MNFVEAFIRKGDTAKFDFDFSKSLKGLEKLSLAEVISCNKISHVSLIDHVSFTEPVSIFNTLSIINKSTGFLAMNTDKTKATVMLGTVGLEKVAERGETHRLTVEASTSCVNTVSLDLYVTIL